MINENAGLLSVTPCVLQQFKFANQGKNFEAIQKSVLDLTKLVQWDQRILQAQASNDVQNSNMLVFRQTINNDDIAGPGVREVVLKRFFFRYHSRLYVYTSSVPER